MAIECPQCGKKNLDTMQTCLQCGAPIEGTFEKSEEEKTNDWMKIGTIVVVVALFAIFVLPVMLQPEKLTVKNVDTQCEPPEFRDFEKYTLKGYQRDHTTPLRLIKTEDVLGGNRQHQRERICFSRVKSETKPFKK